MSPSLAVKAKPHAGSFGGIHSQRHWEERDGIAVIVNMLSNLLRDLHEYELTL